MTMQRVNGNGTIAGADIIERVVAVGDLAGLQPIERARYYGQVCKSVGLNPLTQPFKYVSLNGKLTLYAVKDASDQLRAIHNISITILSRDLDADGVLTVTARASTPSGRQDESIGCVYLGGLKGEALANAKMKAETKAKRRVTLSICGLGWLDETEVADVRAARHVTVTADGEIVEAPPAAASAPQLTEQLAASIDWNAWADGFIGDFDRATEKGQITEMWTLFNEDVRKLKPSPALVDQVKEAKDNAKARLS